MRIAEEFRISITTCVGLIDRIASGLADRRRLESWATDALRRCIARNSWDLDHAAPVLTYSARRDSSEMLAL